MTRGARPGARPSGVGARGAIAARALPGLLVAALALAGCADQVRRPRGIGGGTDDLGRSPCACAPLPAGGPAGWQDEVRRALGHRLSQAPLPAATDPAGGRSDIGRRPGRAAA